MTSLVMLAYLGILLFTYPLVINAARPQFSNEVSVTGYFTFAFREKVQSHDDWNSLDEEDSRIYPPLTQREQEHRDSSFPWFDAATARIHQRFINFPNPEKPDPNVGEVATNPPDQVFRTANGILIDVVCIAYSDFYGHKVFMRPRSPKLIALPNPKGGMINKPPYFMAYGGVEGGSVLDRPCDMNPRADPKWANNLKRMLPLDWRILMHSAHWLDPITAQDRAREYLKRRAVLRPNLFGNAQIFEAILFHLRERFIVQGLRDPPVYQVEVRLKVIVNGQVPYDRVLYIYLAADRSPQSSTLLRAVWDVPIYEIQ